jgi:hypothetical protein
MVFIFLWQIFEMTDTSEYTVEYRILAACWYHECDKSVAEIRSVKVKLRERFAGEPPDTRVIANWEEKLFNSGSILDKHRAGRPNERGDTYDDIEESVRSDPSSSLRKRSEELGIPYSLATRRRTSAHCLSHEEVFGTEVSRQMGKQIWTDSLASSKS